MFIRLDRTFDRELKGGAFVLGLRLRLISTVIPACCVMSLLSLRLILLWKPQHHCLFVDISDSCKKPIMEIETELTALTTLAKLNQTRSNVQRSSHPLLMRPFERRGTEAPMDFTYEREERDLGPWSMFEFDSLPSQPRRRTTCPPGARSAC